MSEMNRPGNSGQNVKCLAQDPRVFPWQRLLVYHTLPPTVMVVPKGASGRGYWEVDLTFPKVSESLTQLINYAVIHDHV